MQSHCYFGKVTRKRFVLDGQKENYTNRLKDGVLVLGELWSRCRLFAISLWIFSVPLDRLFIVGSLGIHLWLFISCGSIVCLFC
jgi:hypothetical protein